MCVQLILTITKDGVTVAGVLMATAGACLLWYFIGEVVTVNRDGIIKGEQVTQTIPATTPELICRLRMHKLMTRIGVILTVLGGLFQIISTFMS